MDISTLQRPQSRTIRYDGSLACVRSSVAAAPKCQWPNAPMWTPDWRRDGKDPDYLFSLANERTFLTWIRTALSLLAGGVALDQFAVKLASPSAMAILATSLALLSAVLCAAAIKNTRPRNQKFSTPAQSA